MRYIVKYGLFDAILFPKCELCGQLNSRTHVTNECDFFKRQRDSVLTQISKIIVVGNLEKGGDLEYWIMNIYFAPNLKWIPRQMRELMLGLKMFC